MEQSLFPLAYTKSPWVGELQPPTPATLDMDSLDNQPGLVWPLTEDSQEHGVEVNQLVRVSVVNDCNNLDEVLMYVEMTTCPSLTIPTNGVITFTPGVDNSNIGLGSVATYSCNLGYVLVGQTTRVCQSLTGTIGVWSGNQPTCQGKIAINFSNKSQVLKQAHVYPLCMVLSSCSLNRPPTIAIASTEIIQVSSMV